MAAGPGPSSDVPVAVQYKHNSPRIIACALNCPQDWLLEGHSGSPVVQVHGRH